mgnify:FL=1
MATESFASFFRTNVASYSRAERTYMAMKTGIYYDRLLGPKAKDLSNWESIGILFGFDPSITQDIRAIQELVMDNKKLYSKHVDTLVRSLRQSVAEDNIQLFDYTKNTILNTVDDDSDRVNIMNRVINKASSNKEQKLFIQYLKMFGPEALDAVKGN